MKADKIIKNAKIYTSDKNKSIVTALAVKDGKFVYVGDEAGVFTELYVEPGVPHAYEYLEWTPQAARFLELRNHATIRMLGTEEKAQTPDAGIELGDLLKYISGMGSTK